MSLALDHFRALREQSSLPLEMPADAAAEKLTQMLTETQQLTLSQLPSSNARQLGSILFSHEAGLVRALSTLSAPEIHWEKARNTRNFWIGLAGIAASLCASALLWEGGSKILALLVFIGAAALAFAAFLPGRKPDVKVTQTIDTGALFSLSERRMEAIDRDLDAFLSIPTEETDSDDSVVRIITLANSLRRQDPDSVPDELMTAITALSISRGYDFLDYTPETEAFFDIMPTKRETRTIVPAVVKENTLIARGMAIKQLHSLQEES